MTRPRESSLGPTLVLMGGQALAFAGTFFIPVILVRIFDPVAFGTYKQLFLVYSTLYLIAPLGMAESLFYFLPRHPERAGRYIANSLAFLALTGGAMLVVLRVGASRLARSLGNPALADYTTLVGAFLVLTMMSYVLEVVMTSRRQFGWAAAAYAGSDLVRAACLVSGAIATRSLRGVFVGAVVFAGLRFAVTLAYLVQELGATLRPDLATLREQLAYAMPFGAAVVVHVLQSTFHQYAVAYAFDTAAFAVYAVGCLSIPIIDLIAGPAGNVMMVRMAEGLRHDQPGEIQAVWHETVRHLALVFFPVTALLIVAAPALITFLFTSTYAASIPIFRVWVVSFLVSTLMTDGVLRVYADTRFLLLQSALRLALNVALMVPFIRLFGLVGAVAVTVVAALVTKAVCLARIARLAGHPLRTMLPWRAVGRVAVAAVAAAVLADIVEVRLLAPPLVRLLVEGATYAVGYLAIAWAAGVLEAGERAAIVAWIRARLGRARVAAPSEVA